MFRTWIYREVFGALLIQFHLNKTIFLLIKTAFSQSRNYDRALLRAVMVNILVLLYQSRLSRKFEGIAGHCWRAKQELSNDLLLWIPWRGAGQIGRPTTILIRYLMKQNVTLMNFRHWCRMVGVIDSWMSELARPIRK